MKYTIRPVASTTVEINGALTTAGSTPAQRAIMGIREPTDVAKIQIETTVTATTAAMRQPTNSAAGKNPTLARVNPSRVPVAISRKTTRKKSLVRISPIPRARTIVVAD